MTKDNNQRAGSMLRRFVHQNWMLLSVFVLAVIVALWFASQAFLNFLYFNDPRNKDVDLKGWMTPKFIVMTYDLPRSVVRDTLKLNELAQARQPLRKIAAELGLSMEELTDLVRETAKAHREAQQ